MKKSMILVLCQVFLLSLLASAQNFTYIGSEKCKMCHNGPAKGDQFKIWSNSLHAKAMASLSSPKSLEYAKKKGIADPTKDAGCLKCHASPAIDKAVGCEACHGPGSAYKAMNIMKDHNLALKNGMVVPDKKTCEKCHNKENPFYKPFDFASASKKIAHPAPKK